MERREFIAASAAAAAAASVGTHAASINESLRANALAVYSSPKVMKLMKADPVLKGMERRLFEDVRVTIRAKTPVIPPYNPFMYERLLAEVSELLDRCLQYRSECNDIEATALKRALDYDLFKQLADNELALQTTLLSGTVAADVKAKLQEILTTRSAELKEYQETLQLRHTTIGHALNYVELRARVIALFSQDLAEAYQKARAAKAGLEAQLGITIQKFPQLADEEDPNRDAKDYSFLDNLVLWTRDAISQYELETSRDVEFERLVPLVLPYLQDPGADGNLDKRVMTRVNFESVLDGGGTFKVPLDTVLKAVLPPNLDRIRLRGVALSAVLVDNTNGSFWSWAGSIALPDAPNPLTPGSVYRWPRVMLGKLGVYQPGFEPVFRASEDIWNCNPLGELEISLERLTNVGVIEEGRGRRKDRLRDLYLHVRLAARSKL